MKIVIEGIPISKVRARTVLRGSYVNTYDPQTEQKNAVKSLMQSNMECLEIVDYPIAVVIDFYMPYPSLSETKLNLLKWRPGSPHKDLDNLLKFYLDCGNGSIWEDDRCIISISSTKKYSDNPRTEIMIESKEKFTLDDGKDSILSIMSPNDVSKMVEDLDELKSLSIIYRMGEPDSTPIPDRVVARVCAILSKFSDTYSDKLRKISKNRPRYWSEFKPQEPADD